MTSEENDDEAYIEIYYIFSHKFIITRRRYFIASQNFQGLEETRFAYSLIVLYDFPFTTVEACIITDEEKGFL